MDPDALLAIIDTAFAARVRGDAEALGPYWAEDATYTMSCAPDLLAAISGGGVPAPGRSAIEAMMERVVLDRAERIHAVVQGLEAAIIWRMVARIGAGAPFTVDTAQFWTFTPAGKVAAVLEFADTAAIAREVERAG